jgi:hypothetical protein
MAELLLLLFALLALGSPTVSICFLLVAIGASVWRQSNLRKELAQFREESSKQNDTLHRELIDLKRQLAASVRPAQEHARDGSVSEKLGDVPKVPSRAEEPSSAAVKEPTEVPARAGPREPESLSPKIAARMAEALKADTDAGVNVPVPPVSTSSGPPHPTAAAQSPTFASVPRTSEAELRKRRLPSHRQVPGRWSRLPLFLLRRGQQRTNPSRSGARRQLLQLIRLRFPRRHPYHHTRKRRCRATIVRRCSSA